MPVLAEQVLSVGVGLVDTWLTGNYLPGDKYLAAIGQIAYLLWLIPNLFSFVAIGATALTARSVGARDFDLARHTTNQALSLGILMAVVVTTSLAIGSDWLIDFLRLPPAAASLAKEYLQIIVYVVPAIMIEQIAIACLRGAGDTASGLMTRVIVNASNVLLSMALVSGWGPLPALGWKGIALGTAISHVIGAVVLLWLLVRGRAGLKIHWLDMKLDNRMAVRLLRIGVPGGIDVLLILSCHLWFVALINSLGTQEAAAHSLAIRIESLSYLPGTAFQVAATTLAGQYLGARDPRRAGGSVLIALLIGGGIMFAAGVVFFLYGYGLATFFTGGANPETSREAARLLKIAAFVMPCLAISMIITGALRGAGDTRWPMAINVMGMFGARIPLAYAVMGPWQGLFATASIRGSHASLLGMWYAMIVDIGLRSALVLLRFWHGGWKKTGV